MNHNTHYNPGKQEQAWLNEKRQYTQCQYILICSYARNTEMCLDAPDTCSIRRQLLQTKLSQLESIARKMRDELRR